MKKREIILWIVCVLLSISLYLSIMLEVWGLTLWGNNVDYSRFGTWGQFISAIGTTIAFFVATASLISTRLIYQATEKKKDKEEETSIFLWLTFKEIQNDENEIEARLWDLIVHNTTKAPIYRWLVTFYSDKNHLCNFQKRPILPGENIFNLPFFDNLEASKSPLATLFIEGKSGRYWSRTSKGELNEVSINEIKCNHN